MQPIARVLVIGYGVMGRGIVRSFVDGGFETLVWSRRAAELGDLPPGARAFAELPPDLPPDLAIETVPEQVETKAAVYRALEALYPADMVIGSNTSGLPLEALAAGLDHPARFVGTHYFMPADVFPMVEVAAGPVTPPDVVDRVAEAMARTGKDAIRLYKPAIGLLINRLQHALLHEAYHIIEQGIASPAEIDRVARWMLGPRLAIGGLIEQKDIGGLAIHADAQRSIVPALNHTGVPNAYMQGLSRRGENGLDAGLGFYDWRGIDPVTVRRENAARLKALLAFLEQGLPLTTPGTTPRDRPLER